MANGASDRQPYLERVILPERLEVAAGLLAVDPDLMDVIVRDGVALRHSYI